MFAAKYYKYNLLLFHKGIRRTTFISSICAHFLVEAFYQTSGDYESQRMKPKIKSDEREN